MRKIFKYMLIFVIIAMIVLPSFSVLAEEKPEITTDSAILIDFRSGKVLYEKNADERTYPASTTKVMTAILAIENLDYATVLTASETAINIERDGSNIGILNGEQFTVEQLLYALLVHSANDAANMLAEAVSGSISDFVVLMNQKATELGMKNTNFVNAHGYHNESHYMSARDLALLSSYAMKNEKFAAIVSVPTYELPPTEKYPQIRYLSSNNMLINKMKGRKYIYEPALGIKTGHTDDAGFCLASFAEQDSEEYICVTMKSPIDENYNYSFKDTITLFEYAFKTYDMKTISNVGDILATAPVKWAKGGKHAVLTTTAAIERLLPAGFNTKDLTTNISFSEKVKAPVKQGDVLGSIEYVYEDESLGVVDLVAMEDVKRSFSKMIFGTFFDFLFSAWVMVPFFTIVVLLLIVRSYNLRKRRKRREMLRRQNRNNF